jgi:hypothetical protein
MIGGEWKRAEGERQSPYIRFRLYRTPVGVIYAPAGETSRAMRLALLISATRRS